MQRRSRLHAAGVTLFADLVTSPAAAVPIAVPALLSRSPSLLIRSHRGVFHRESNHLHAGRVTFAMRVGHIAMLQKSPTYILLPL